MGGLPCSQRKPEADSTAQTARFEDTSCRHSQKRTSHLTPRVQTQRESTYARTRLRFTIFHTTETPSTLYLGSMQPLGADMQTLAHGAEEFYFCGILLLRSLWEKYWAQHHGTWAWGVENYFKGIGATGSRASGKSRKVRQVPAAGSATSASSIWQPALPAPQQRL